MTETEKKLASNASLLTGVTMLVAMPFWFEIIVVSDQILMLPWMVMSFALIVLIYYSKKLIEDRAYGVLYSRKFDEELENTLRTMRAEAFVEFKDLD